MAARKTALSTSRVILGQPTRLTLRPAKSSAVVSQLHSSAVTYSANSAAATPAASADDAPIPGATYVHIPPLEIPAEGLVPSQGSAQIRAIIGMQGPTLTVAHSLAIIKSIEAKCGPVVSAHHRRVSDPSLPFQVLCESDDFLRIPSTARFSRRSTSSSSIPSPSPSLWSWKFHVPRSPESIVYRADHHWKRWNEPSLNAHRSPVPVAAK